jgi:hypothetical protein
LGWHRLSARSQRNPNDDFLDLAGYFGSLRPNLTGQPIFLDTPTPFNVGQTRILNSAAFAAPPSFVLADFAANGDRTLVPVTDPRYAAYYSDPNRFFGTAPLVNTDVRSDPFISENFNILKKTRITETVTIEIGAEFFNIFNRVRFLQPNTDLGRLNNNGTFDNGQFGVEGAVDQPRVIQFRARVIF